MLIPRLPEMLNACGGKMRLFARKKPLSSGAAAVEGVVDIARNQ